MSNASGYALLGAIDDPAALRALPAAQLAPLADEIRRFLIETLARVGGHFSASLGVVELTLALHRAYDTPRDALVWDIGHQAYVHKLLTGRRAQLETIRHRDGLAPFLTRDESAYDAFGAGHAGTAISAAAGFAAAAKLRGDRQRAVAIVGDGGLTAGMSFEALNHAGAAKLDLLVVLNDNGYSISENVGALREHGDSLSGFFAALGFTYCGPIDGHDLAALDAALKRMQSLDGPKLLHVITRKGAGYAPAEAAPIAFHGVTRFDPVTGALPVARAAAPSFSQVFGDWLCATAAIDPRVVAITPAMREGSGLVEFARRFPERYHDVAIAEQHAVTFAAGLAAGGARPVVAIYSTFLQRALDQLIHDVALQNLPVLVAIDRGGLVGPDGATHHGAYDLSLLRAIPNLAVLAPSDAGECRRLLATALAHDGPVAVRYPRGAAGGDASATAEPLPFGRGRIVRSGSSRRRPKIALLVFGSLVGSALEAAGILDATVADMRFVKPLDEALVAELAASHELLVTIEDNAIAGGAGSAVNEALLNAGARVGVLNLGLPDRFLAHGSREELLAEAGLDAAGILRAIQKRLRASDFRRSDDDSRREPLDG